MHMNTLKTLTSILIAVLLVTTINSCAAEKYLRTEKVITTEITGTYTLILYGGRYSDDVETAAIFDKEGDPYSFEIFAPEYDYTVKKGLPAREALEDAEKFISFHHSFWRSRLSKIIDKEGNTIGYELRPLYFPSEFGYSDVLYIDYFMKDNKVITLIRLKQELENKNPFLFRGIMRQR